MRYGCLAIFIAIVEFLLLYWDNFDAPVTGLYRNTSFKIKLRTANDKCVEILTDIRSCDELDCVLWINGTSVTGLNYKRCAYIANSGHMTGSKLGQSIDSFDCVIRSNDAPTTNYEDDVGTKTTLRTVDRRSLNFINDKFKKGNLIDKNFLSESLVVVLQQFDTFDRFLSTWPTVKFARINPEVMNEIRKKFNESVDNIDNGLYVSSAFSTLLLASHFCSEISVFGMADADYCDRLRSGVPGLKNANYHYYPPEDGFKECEIFDKHERAKTATHRFFKEKLFFRNWSMSWRGLRFYNPDW